MLIATNENSIQSMLNEAYGRANHAIMNSNPIIKYVFNLVSNSSIETNDNERHDDYYSFDIDFATNFAISNTDDDKTDKVMFMELYYKACRQN